MFRFLVLFLIGFSIVLLNCKSSPTSSKPYDDPIDNTDEGDSGDGGTQEPEPTIIEIPYNYQPFYPYQSLFYYNEEFELEDYGFEFVWGLDSVDNEYDLYKRFDLVYYQDTLAVGDTLTAKVKDWGQWAITIPRIEAGNYNFTVFIKEDLLLKGEVEILPTQVISDPVSYVQTEFFKFKDQMSLVKADAEKVMQDVPSNNDGNDENFVEQMNKALDLYNQLELKIFNDIQKASPEALERLAYFMKAYEEILNEEYEPFEDVLGKANHDPLAEPESAFENGKKWLTNKINFKGILDAFWNSDTKNVEVGEGDLVETAKTWTVYGQAISIITGIQERFTKVFMLTTDKLEAELKGDFSNESESNPKSKKFAPHLDTLRFEYETPIRLSFTGEYENLIQEYRYSTYGVVNVLSRELYDLIYKVDFYNGDLSLFSTLREDTVNIIRPVKSKYLDLNWAGNQYTDDRSFNDLFDVQKDENTGEFILTAKIQKNEDDVPIYGDLETQVRAEYYQNPEYDGFEYLFVASNCPDFSLFMTGKWQLRYYTDDTRTVFRQTDRQEYFTDGTWVEKESRFANESEWIESIDTGTWVGECDNDGQAWLVWYHDFLPNIAYVFKYEGNKDQIFGYSSGLSNNGYNLELRKGW